MKDNSFSNFIRNGTPEKKKEVYNDVINESIQDQKQSMTSTIEKEGNLLPHNTTEERNDWNISNLPKDVFSVSIGGKPVMSATDEKIQELINNYNVGINGVAVHDHAEMLQEMAVFSHNLALQQVLEKAEDYKISKEAVKVNKLGADYIFWYDLKLAITSLQKE
jgi:hypothetical protein